MCMRWMCASSETLSRGCSQYRSAVWWTITVCAGFFISVLSRASTAFHPRRLTTVTAKQQCVQTNMLEIVYSLLCARSLAFTCVHIHGFSRCASVHISDQRFFQTRRMSMTCKLTSLIALNDWEGQTCWASAYFPVSCRNLFRSWVLQADMKKFYCMGFL